MTAFRILLVSIILTVGIYTIPVALNHGLFELFGIFFRDIARMEWPGQFNLDFATYIILGGVWMTWRNQFSPGGLVLGICAPLGGAPLLCSYLLYLSYHCDGDVHRMFFGDRAATD